MNKEVIGFIKYLYNEDNISIDSIYKTFEKLEKDLHLTKYELICDFENDLTNKLRDFKTEILDQMLILLSQLEDIQQIKEVYSKLSTIQSMLKRI